MNLSKNKKVLLLTLHNDKSLGVRCIAKSLINEGYEPTVLFLKSNIYNPQPVSEQEISLLKEFVLKEKYLFIGISILSSFTITEIQKVTGIIKSVSNVPVVWGGTYVSIMPRYSAEYCDIAVKGEGEKTIVMLAEAFRKKSDWKNIPNICYFDKNKEYKENELADIVQNIDDIAYPILGYENTYLIESNTLTQGDPILSTDFYEISCSRGCPFSCSYCCSSTIRRLYKGKGKYLRFRSVESVISELKEAKKKIPQIKSIRFWDEVFSNEKKWVENFVELYKKEINIPFQIWGHPLMVKNDIIKMLSSAGMERIVIGFQSGSPYVRNKIFKRPESNEQIIEASKIVSSHKIPEVYYDLMICHPFESLKHIKETFDLCLQLEPPFRLNIHGLGFLPGADINQLAIDSELYTEEEMDKMFKAPSDVQFKQFYGSNSGYYGEEHKKEVWADLIYLTQFAAIRNKVIKLSKNPDKNKNIIKKLKIKIENMEYEKQEILKRPMTLVNKIIKIPDLIF